MQLTCSIDPGQRDYAFTMEGTEKARVSESLFYASLILHPEDNTHTKGDAGFWGKRT